MGLNHMKLPISECFLASQVALVVKNPPVNAGDVKDTGFDLRWGRSPREEQGNPRQYSCLENCMDRRTWQATVRSVARSWTQLKQLCSNALCPNGRKIQFNLVYPFRDTNFPKPQGVREE